MTAADRPLSPRQIANRLRACVERSSGELRGAEERGLDVANLDAEGRAAVSQLLADLVKRGRAMLRALRKADRDAAEVVQARAELRAEAEARHASDSEDKAPPPTRES